MNMTDFKIALRPYQLDDAPLLFEAASESIADIYPWMPWCHPGYMLAESEAWIPQCIAEREAKRAFDFVVFDQATGQFLGAVGSIRFIPCTNLPIWVTGCAAAARDTALR